jgi:hypothetical protein
VGWMDKGEGFEPSLSRSPKYLAELVQTGERLEGGTRTSIERRPVKKAALPACLLVDSQHPISCCKTPRFCSSFPQALAPLPLHRPRKFRVQPEPRFNPTPLPSARCWTPLLCRIDCAFAHNPSPEENDLDFPSNTTSSVDAIPRCVGRQLSFQKGVENFENWVLGSRGVGSGRTDLRHGVRRDPRGLCGRC